MITKSYFEIGIEFFEKYDYETAIKNFMISYKKEAYQDDILEILYSCFITPNEAEFQKNYETMALTSLDIPYEETEIDFIPVSDTRFFLWNKTEKEFLGSCDLAELRFEKEQEQEFDSLLIADIWDIFPISKEVKAYRTSDIYVVLNKEKKKFASFFKLPQFYDLFVKYATIFETTREMEYYFQQNYNCYLPKKILAENSKKYVEILEGISEHRIQNIDKIRDNIFLSICIPTYNRGKTALKNILNLLQSRYDAEIEIVISDNGSTEHMEGYETISQLQDSRVNYVRHSQNEGYSSNIYHVLKQAKGKFLILSSDEDTMFIADLPEYMKYLKNHQDAAVIRTSGMGSDFIKVEKTVFTNKEEAIQRALDFNYLTGITFNGEILRKYNLFEEYEKLRGNIFLEFYGHIVFAMLACKYGVLVDMPMVLCCAMEEFDSGITVNSDTEEERLYAYAIPESRIQQFEAAMELVYLLLGENEVSFWRTFLLRVRKTYHLIYVAANKESFRKEYRYEEACMMIYQASIAYIHQHGLYNAVKFEDMMMDLYQTWLGRKPY